MLRYVSFKCIHFDDYEKFLVSDKNSFTMSQISQFFLSDKIQDSLKSLNLTNSRVRKFFNSGIFVNSKKRRSLIQRYTENVDIQIL